MVVLTIKQLEQWALDLENTHKDATDEDVAIALCTRAYMQGIKDSIKVIEAYKVSVGNSASGERAAEWTMENLREIREELRGIINELRAT